MKTIATLKITDAKTLYHVIQKTEKGESVSSMILSELEFRQYEFKPKKEYEIEVIHYK